MQAYSQWRYTQNAFTFSGNSVTSDAKIAKWIIGNPPFTMIHLAHIPNNEAIKKSYQKSRLCQRCSLQNIFSKNGWFYSRIIPLVSSKNASQTSLHCNRGQNGVKTGKCKAPFKFLTLINARKSPETV